MAWPKGPKRANVLHGAGHRSGVAVPTAPMISPGPGLAPVAAHPLHGKGHRYAVGAKRNRKPGKTKP